MTLTIIRSDQVYRNLIDMPVDKRRSYFKSQLLEPFKPKFYQQGIPYEAKIDGGFDAMMLLSWMHLMPEQLTEADLDAIATLDESFWQTCEEAIVTSLNRFKQLSVQDYTFTTLLANPDAPLLRINEGCLGDGGIPGYIFLSLSPRPEALASMQATLAHEVNHNVRYQFVAWDNASLKEMIVAEGLAESFAMQLYGLDQLGPWVSKTDKHTLNRVIKPALRQNLELGGFPEITPYLYGDEIATMMGYKPVGMPYCAGYACGYYLIQHYLAKTGQSIETATTLPASDILKEVDDFWTNDTL